MKQQAQRVIHVEDDCKVTLGLPGTSTCLHNHRGKSCIEVDVPSPRTAELATEKKMFLTSKKQPFVQASIQRKGLVMDLHPSITSRKQSGIDDNNLEPCLSINATTLMLDRTFNPLNEMLRKDDNDDSLRGMILTPNLHHDQSLEDSQEMMAIKELMTLENSNQKQKAQTNNQMNQFTRSKTMLDRKSATLAQSITKTDNKGGGGEGVQVNVPTILAPHMTNQDHLEDLTQRKSLQNLPQHGTSSQMGQRQASFAQRIKSQVKQAPYRDSGASFSISSSIQPEAVLAQNSNGSSQKKVRKERDISLNAKLPKAARNTQIAQQTPPRREIITGIRQGSKALNSKTLAGHKMPNQDLHQFVPTKDKFERNTPTKTAMSDCSKLQLQQRQDESSEFKIVAIDEQTAKLKSDAEDTQTQYNAIQNYDADLINARPCELQKATHPNGSNLQLQEPSIGSSRGPPLSPSCVAEPSPSFASFKQPIPGLISQTGSHNDYIKLMMPSMVLLKSKVVQESEASSIDLVGAPPQSSLKIDKWQQMGQLEAKSRFRGGSKKSQSLTRPNKVMMRPESVTFSVQPKQNHLVTPDHPLFLHAMQKLQIYKRQMVSTQQSRGSVQHRSSSMGQSGFAVKRPVSQMSIQEGSLFVQLKPPAQPTPHRQVDSVETLAKDQTSVICTTGRNTEPLVSVGRDQKPTSPKSKHQGAETQNLDYSVAPSERGRCNTSFGVMRPQRVSFKRDSTTRSLRSSLKDDSLQKLSTTKLPFHYRQMKQNVTLKQKLRTQATEHAVKRLAVRGAQASMQPFNKLLDNLSQKQTKAASRQRQNRRKKMQTRGAGDEEETCTLLQHMPNDSKTPLLSPKCSSRFVGSSLENLIHDSNDRSQPLVGQQMNNLPNHNNIHHRSASTSQHRNDAKALHSNQRNRMLKVPMQQTVAGQNPLDVTDKRKSDDTPIKQNIPSQQHLQAAIKNIVPGNYLTSRTNNFDVDGSIQTMNQASDNTIHQIPMQVLSSKISEGESPQRKTLNQQFFQGTPLHAIEAEHQDGGQLPYQNILMDNTSELGLAPNRTRSLHGTGVQRERAKTLTSLNQMNGRAVTAKQDRTSILTMAPSQQVKFNSGQYQLKQDEEKEPQVSININRQQSHDPDAIKRKLSHLQQEGVIQYENANGADLASGDIMKHFTDQDILMLQNMPAQQMKSCHYHKQLQSFQNHQKQQYQIEQQKKNMDRARPKSQTVFQSCSAGRLRRRKKENDARQRRLQQILNKHPNSKATKMLFGTAQDDAAMAKKHFVLGGCSPANALQSIIGVGNIDLAEQLLFSQELDPTMGDTIVNEGQNYTNTEMPQEEQSKLGMLERTQSLGGTQAQGLRLKNDYDEQTNHQKVTSGLMTSTMNYIMHDMKYKEVAQGLPANLQVKATTSKTGLRMQHHGSYSFTSPQEIQYEIKKKLNRLQRARSPQNLVAKSRASTQNSVPRQKEQLDYQSTMLMVPGKRFNSTMPLSTEAQTQPEEATANYCNKIANGSLFTAAPIMMTDQAQKLKQNNYGSQNAFSFCGDGLDGQRRSTLFGVTQNLSSLASIQSPYHHARQESEVTMNKSMLQKSPTFEPNTQVIDAQETTVADSDLQSQDQKRRTRMSGKRRSIELQPQQVSDLGENKLVDNIEGEDPQTRRILMSSLEEQALKDASTDRIKQRDTEQKPISGEQNIVDPNVMTLAKSIGMSHDGESTEMRTARHSSESLLFRDMMSVLPQNVVIENMGAESLSFNNSKLWQKQFGRMNIKHRRDSDTNSQNARSSNKARGAFNSHHHRFHSDQVPQMSSTIMSGYGQKSSLVNDILSQTLRMINKQIPVKSNIMQQRPAPKNGRQRILRHRENQLQQRFLQNTQVKKKEKTYTKPISGNHFLVPSHRTNNLSSYAHPKNAHIQEKEVTESLEL